MGLWAIIGILCGLALGIGLALSMVVTSIKESNDMGDSKGSMRDFGATMNMLYSANDLRQIPIGGRNASSSTLAMRYQALEKQL